MRRPRRILARLKLFFLPRENDYWLAALRIGLGLQLALYCLFLRGDWNVLFAGTGKGLLSRQLSEIMASVESPFLPRLGWLIAVGQQFGFGEKAILNATWIALLAAAFCLMTGLVSRTAAIVAWFLHLCAAKSGGLLSYGVDNLMTIGFFYFMWAPSPDRFSLDAKLWQRVSNNLRASGLLRRLLQLHLCVIYFFGGLTKCLGNGWWNGQNIWRALTREPFDVLPIELIVKFQWILPLLGISIWVIEISYPVLIWPTRTRAVWLTLTCAMHLAIGLAMGMYLFALIMIALNVAAFGVGAGRAKRPLAAPKPA